MSSPKPPVPKTPGATRALQVTTAAFAVGMALAAPAIAAADTADTGSVDQKAQARHSVTGERGADAGARPARNPGVRESAARSGRAAQRTAAGDASASATGADAAAAEAESGRTAAEAKSGRTAAEAESGRTAAEAESGRTAAEAESGRTAAEAKSGRTAARVAPRQAARRTAPTAAPSTPADATVTTSPVASPVADEAPAAPTELSVDAPAAPIALAVAAAPPAAAATGTPDLFAGLFTPIQSFFEGIALLIRRTFFNQAPTVAPVQTTGQLTGPITGTIGAVDPEGDPLTYEVTATPRYGSVAVAADGSYLYTPGAGFTGLDSFTIAVTDTGFHINLLDLSRPASTEAFLQVAQNATLPMLTFSFVYGNGSQYWTADARGGLQEAAMLLAASIVVDAPVTVVYSVTGESSPSSSTLASAGSDLTDSGAGFFATVVQRKIQTGSDANGVRADGDITWNFGNPWAFGADVGADEYDFVSTAMHELLHTLGFLSYTLEPGSNTGRSWTTFDQYVVTADGTRVITDSYRWRTAYDANLTGGAGGLYFGGPNAVAAYGGLVPLYTPDPWESGSSMSHLDDATFTDADTKLMNAETESGLGIRVISPVELAILKDLGYSVTEPAPLQALLLLLGIGFLRRRPQRPVSWSIRL